MKMRAEKNKRNAKRVGSLTFLHLVILFFLMPCCEERKVDIIMKYFTLVVRGKLSWENYGCFGCRSALNFSFEIKEKRTQN